MSAGVLRDAGEVLLDTEDARFADDPEPPRIDKAEATIEFSRPGAVLIFCGWGGTTSGDSR